MAIKGVLTAVEGHSTKLTDHNIKRFNSRRVKKARLKKYWISDYPKTYL